MSSLAQSLLSVHAPDELSTVMVQEEAPTTPEFNTSGLDLRTFPEFVRDIECDVTFAWEPGEIYRDRPTVTWDIPSTAELISVKDLGGRDLLADLDDEEKNFLIDAATREAVAEDERRRAAHWWK